MPSWLKWGLPVTLVVLLAASGTGVLLADRVYRSADAAAPPQQSAGGFTSRSGVVYSPEAAAHPDRPMIEPLLDRHFDSINQKNYDLWKSTVVPAKWTELPKEKWFESYDTTQDFGMTVTRIDPGPDRSTLVMLTFRSGQAIEDAPPQLPKGCVVWNVVYPVVADAETGGWLRLDTSKLPNSALVSPCS